MKTKECGRLLLSKNVRDNPSQRESFMQLAADVFGLSFHNWYARGYWQDAYLPYTLFDCGRAVANISVNRMKTMVDGQPKRYIQLGTVMTAARRLEILRWASEAPDRYIIEDDYDSEFRYASRPIPALGELDRTGRVVYVNTFAKSLAPGLRIGYLVLPNALMARYRERFSRYSSTVPSFDQYTLAAFMHTGGFERHISRSRKIYQARRDALMAALDRELADLPHEVSRSEAGLHLLLHMRNGMLEHELIERAKTVGVRVYPLSAYYTPPVKPPRATLVLGYAGLTEQQIDEAAKRLKQAWTK